VAADAAQDSGKIGLNGVFRSSSRSARLLVVETVNGKAADASETPDNADASESSDGLRMRSYSSSSSYVLSAIVVTNQAVEVAALPSPPNVFMVSIDVFEPVE
jgi:hypothetical protein